MLLPTFSFSIASGNTWVILGFHAPQIEIISEPVYKKFWIPGYWFCRAVPSEFITSNQIQDQNKSGIIWHIKFLGLNSVPLIS